MWPHSRNLGSIKRIVWALLLLISTQVLVAMLPVISMTGSIANFVPLHTVLETFAIVISMLVFAVGWSSYRAGRSISPVFLACIFLGVGLIDLMHVLSYPGMPDFISPNNPDKTINFWLAARLLNALGLLALVLIPWRQQHPRSLRWWMLGSVIGLVGLVSWIGIFHQAWLPTMYETGSGLTPFKVGFEYLLAALFILTALGFLYKLRSAKPYLDLFAAACIMAMSEVFFTWYNNFTDIYNLLGHIYKVIAYVYIYRSIFLASVHAPYEQLSESRNLLQTVIDTLPMRVFWKNSEFRLMGCNTAFAQDLGLNNPQDAFGKKEHELLPIDRVTAYQREDLRVMSSGIPEAALRKTSLRFGEEEKWLRSSKLPLLNAKKETIGVLGMYEDVTEQVGTNEKLYLYQSLVEYSADPIAILDPFHHFRIVYANKAACEHFNTTLETLLNTHAWDWDPIYDPVKLEHFWRRLKGRKNILLQSSHRKSTGEVVPVEISASYLQHDERELMVAYVRDITKRKEIEESMKLASLVYQSSSEAMAVTNLEGIILDINPAFTEVTGYSREEVLGKNASILSSDRQDDAFYQAMWQSINTTGTWQGEIWNKRKNGEIYAEWLSINTIYDENGLPYRRVELFSDITKRKESEQIIWHQANFDPLTGLPNRNMFQDRLDQEIKKATRTGQPLALMFLDLDRFKDINDTLGHAMGDELLKETAHRISACVRATDTVARLGGDEFTVILGELEDTGGIERISRKILESLAEPFHLGEDVVYITVSIGLTFYPEDAENIPTLLKNADQAMYAAKSQGRNRYNYFTASMQEAAQTRMRLVSDMRTALMENQFRLHYQPVVELATGHIHKAEALIRWLHPVLGLVSPVQFIPVAEETGMINEIGDWVFREAAKQAAEWRAAHDSQFQISINKSPVQFQHGGTTLSLWIEHLQQLGLPGQGIVVEITEGLLLDASPAVSNQLLEMREAGIQVAIDDFGTGYSSLAYLKRFDIDYVKIDRSFVRNMATNPSDVILCEAIIVMAHKLGMQVIAEGVETDAQRQLLLAAGCDYGQGFLFSQAVTAEEFELLLKKGL
jgi:diguanylate cyclase (GGDEF)-like protein/PAS domain S-box-containing protein